MPRVMALKSATNLPLEPAMPPPSADVARIARRFAGADRVDQALGALGPEGARVFDVTTGDARTQLIARFVRGLRDMTVEESMVLEREICLALDAVPRGEKSFALEGPMALVALRNAVRVASMCTGMTWASGMHVQSVVSDFARDLSTVAGSSISVRIDGDRFAICARVPQASADHVERAKRNGEPWFAALSDASISVVAGGIGSTACFEFQLGPQKKAA
jgi:hypothetical protein